jgi:hypothetical protein
MEWISLEDRIPDNRDIILTCDCINEFISLGRYLEEIDEFQLMNIDFMAKDSYPTHWMPLPELPREE